MTTFPNSLTGAPPELPCKQCSAPTPAIALPGEGRTVHVAGTCNVCQAAMFHEIEAPPEDGTPGTKLKNCRRCGGEFEAPTLILFGRLIDTVTTCEPCSTRQESPKQAAYIAAREAEWNALCPEYYRTEGIIKALPPARLEAVKAQMKKHGGVLIHGASGKFKTTSVYHGAVKPLVWKKNPVEVILASEWKTACAAAAGRGEVRQFLRPLINAPHLFIDDIGNMGGTRHSEDCLHALMERRNQKSLKLMATTQYKGTDLLSRFESREMGEAIIRRMVEMCGEPISFR